MLEILKETGGNIPESLQTEIKATPNVSIEEINKKFKDVSDIFFNHYRENISLDSKKVSLEDISQVAKHVRLTQLSDSEQSFVTLKEKSEELQK